MPVSRRSEPFSFESWCQKELTRLLGFPVGDDLIAYLLSIETKKDVKEYLDELLGTDKKASRDFQVEFFGHWHPPERAPCQPSQEEEELLTELIRPKKEEMVLFADKPDKNKKKDVVNDFNYVAYGGMHTQEVTKKTHERLNIAAHPASHQEEPMRTQHFQLDSTSISYDPKLPKWLGQTRKTGLVSTSQTSNRGRQKQKFVPLMSVEGQTRATMQLPGRHPCHCLAQKHALINNCTECGRIVCAQEGIGPCLFCGAFVCTPEEQELFNRDSKKGHKFREQYMRKFVIKDGDSVGLSGGEGLDKAVQLKKKLLEFDQTSINRTKVIDDEMDYFSVDSNRWLSQKEREKLRSKEEQLRKIRHASRRNQVLTLDFAGRRVVEDKNRVDIYSEEHVADALGGSKQSTFWESQGGSEDHMTHAGGIYNPAISGAPPEYQETNKEMQKRRKREANAEERKEQQHTLGTVRLQDSALQEMRDEGRCLSMHQPWASLLVAGIKRHEGRTWYSTHRGRLWIAATVKEPTEEEVKKVEDFYRSYYEGVEIAFPAKYPTSCLLGCVDMVDCLSQEEYIEKYPGGESESPFVFVMENPCELNLKFSVKGQHKIWKLDASMHVAAKRQDHRPSIFPTSL